MRLLRVLRHRLRSVFRRDAADDELQRELQLHLDLLAREHMAAGAAEADAGRAARRDFGSRDAVLEQCRDTRRVGLFEDLLSDLKYACRLLHRSPTFTTTAVLSLALGLGANIAVFAVVDAVFVRMLPVARPHELVFIHVAGVDASAENGAPPYPCFDRLRREAAIFAGLSAFASDDLQLELDGGVEQAFGQVVSGNYFELLGVKPLIGRVLTPDDERLDPPVAVIGYGYWQRRFGGRPEAIGRTLSFKHRVFTIVGVTPPSFSGLQPGRQVDVSLPITLERELLADSGSWWFDAVGRVPSGISWSQASAQADTIYQSFMKDRHPSNDAWRKYFDHIELTTAARGLDGLRTRFSHALVVLMLVSALVLIVACTNLGNLLLVRSAARQREFAIRLATGAGTGRLVRQLLTETLLLFGLGLAVAGVLATLSIRALTPWLAIGRMPVVLDVHVDWRVAGFAAFTTLLAGMLTAFWPVLRAITSDPHPALKHGDTRIAGERHLGPARHMLVAGQVALSLVLLVAAAMFVRTLDNLRSMDTGFSPHNVLTMSINPLLPPDAAASTRPMVWHQVLDRIRTMPGVHAASLSVLSPLSGRDAGRSITIAGYQPQSDEDRDVHVNHVSEDYFRAFGIALMAGRDFTARDTTGAPNVAILNQTAARAYFADRNPIGQMVRFGEHQEYEVIGIARNATHRSLRESAPRFVYVPLWQPLEGLQRMTLAVRSVVPTATLAHDVEREVHALRPGILVSDVIAAQEQLDATLISERLLSVLGAAFAIMALSLAAIGLHGIVSYNVARRRSELGIRIALGAGSRRVAWTVGREVVVQIGVGLLIGLPLALLTAHTAEGILFGVSAVDPRIYALCATLLAAIGCSAAWLPTWRACTTDPAEALRRD